MTIIEDCKGEKRNEKPQHDRPKREECKVEEKSGIWRADQSLVVGKKDGCAYCLGDHGPGNCEKVTTVTKRKEILRRFRRCCGCLRTAKARKHVNMEK